MDAKKMLACLQDKLNRHRVTIPVHVKKWLDRLRSADAERQRGSKAGQKRKKARKGACKAAYARLDKKKRIQIETLWREKYSKAEIARIVGCHRSTVGRELERNKSQKGYRSTKAQSKTDGRMRKKASARHKLTQAQWEKAKAKLREDWTFEQFSARERLEGRACVSRETLYKEYYARQRLVFRGMSDEDLPPLPMRRKKRKARDRNAKKYRTAGRGRIPGRVDISERPKEIEKRARIGHWEGDLINGNRGTGNIATLCERKSRFMLFAYVATKETEAVMATMAGMLKGLPPELLKTLTFDNGKEFALFKILRREFGLDVYFAHPYHSWERGTNENRNGIIRKVLPKGSDFDHITPEQMARIDHALNDRPMKCLGWRTPREVFMARLAYHLKAA